MIKYRLLRDNKESGPYSEEEMIAKGFKPYDLLWAEGKTAGWQYPSEIMAFKKFAPVVEEQPYDRFYKKPAAQKQVLVDDSVPFSNYQPKAPKENNALKEIPVTVQPAASNYSYNLEHLPARHIHVTLPSGNTVNLTTIVARNDARERQPADGIVQEKIKKENVIAKDTDQKQMLVVDSTSLRSSENNISGATVSPANNFYKESRDQQASRLQASKSSQSNFSWSLVGASVLGIATLVGLGIMIGLSINRQKTEDAFNQALARNSKQAPAPLQKTGSNNSLPVVAGGEPSPTGATQSLKKEFVQNAVIKNQQDAQTTKEITKAATDKVVIEKNGIVERPEHSLPQAKTAITVGTALIEKRLSLRENDFKTGAFGGISNLKLTLVNGSSFPLESVQVEVDYILASKKVYKTEIVLFKDMAAGAQLTVDAPASSRGIKVSSRITKVNTKETALSATSATVKS